MILKKVQCLKPVSYTHLIPKEFIPSVQKGFTTAMKNGVLAGYPFDSLKVTLIDGSFHPVDSEDVYKRQIQCQET